MLLPDFHKVLQTIMGWTNSHLHHFIRDRTYYTLKLRDDDFWNTMDNVEYSNKKITDLLKNERDKIIYEYDFGDSLSVTKRLICSGHMGNHGQDRLIHIRHPVHPLHTAPGLVKDLQKHLKQQIRTDLDL